MLEKDSDGVFNLHAISFLTIAVILTLFSVFYGGWYHSNITGYAPEEPPDIEEIPCEDEVVSTSCDGNSAPPQQVVEEVSANAQVVSQNANYAESVSNIVSSSNQISEPSLQSYREKLEIALQNALQVYGISSADLIKYSYSGEISQIQEEMVKDISTIERRLREINSLLTQTVSERFEEQTEYAVWVINRQETVGNSLDSLESFSSDLVPSGFEEFDISSIVIEPLGQFNLEVLSPGTVNVVSGITGSFQIRITNRALEQVNNCLISFSESIYSSWLTWNGFNSPVGYNSLAPGQTGIYYLEVNAVATQGIYFVDGQIICDEGVTDRFAIAIDVSGGGTQTGGTGSISSGQLNNFLNNYPLNLLNNDCSDLLQFCSSTTPNTCGEYSMLYECAVNQNCLEFWDLCLLNYIPQQQLDDFIDEYVTPYNNLPSSCLNDVSICSHTPVNCPSYIYRCAVNQNCLEYQTTCLSSSGSQFEQGIGGSSEPIFSGGSSGGSSSGLTGANGSSGLINGPSGCQGNEECLELVNTCLTPSYIIATSLNLVDFGGFGYNPVTGQICYMGQSDVYVRPGIDSTLQTGIGQINPGDRPIDPNRANNLLSIHFQGGSRDGSNRNYVASVVYKLNGHLTLNFLSSPNYSGLEDKIYDFIEKLLYGEVQGSYITGMSLQQADEIVNETASIPWILWIILFTMLTSFLFFGNLLLPYNERLIISGKRALNRKDYAQAIDAYNKLAEVYSKDSSMGQEILDYLKLVKGKIGESKINLNYSKNSLPKISYSNSAGIFSDYSRVKKMINHAFEDLKKSPQLAKSRMPLISEEYRRLIPEDRKRLAQDYENLYYKLRLN